MADWFQVVLLALIQGLSEFLPISSSAHLVLPAQLMGWPDQGLLFDVAVHIGTLLAVLAYYRHDLLAVAGDLVPRLRSQRWQPGELGRLALATAPAVAAGLLFGDLIESHLRGVGVIAFTTIVFGLLLGVAARKPGAHDTSDSTPEPVTLRDAVLIGVAQMLALVPGVSRSGVTITAALLLGYRAGTAARFSFLLSVPLIAGAMLFLVLDIRDSGLGAVTPPQVVVAMAIAGISAYLTIAAFISLLGRIGLMPFVIYRLVLGAVLVALVVFEGV